MECIESRFDGDAPAAAAPANDDDDDVDLFGSDDEEDDAEAERIKVNFLTKMSISGAIQIFWRKGRF